MGSNHSRVTKGFDILIKALAPFVANELQGAHGDKWWEKGVLGALHEEQRRDLPLKGDKEKLQESLDIARCLALLDYHWKGIFGNKLSPQHKTWARTLKDVRNTWAHPGSKDFTEVQAWSALETMSLLADEMNRARADEIRALLQEARQGPTEKAPEFATSKNILVQEATTDTGLPSWRSVMQPHPDVAQGRYKNAEFAANLAEVARGEGAYEYLDPVEFFARTFVTEGMTGLLEQSLRRLCGKDGEPVIQLKTAFGGGKTHSLIALYHLLRGRAPLEKIPGTLPALKRAGLSSLPKANVAAIVGFHLDPTKSRRPSELPGATVNTIWGEIAAQLAISLKKPRIFDLVKESDKRGVSPGAQTLKELFNAAAPCMILLDELVAYARKIYGKKDLPSGSFDNFLSFIQELTEAARTSNNGLVVATIPESEAEVGTEGGGKIALEAIERLFGRMESIWRPVAANEGFEVVRRRLFLDCKNPEGREKICSRFSQMYAENQGDFPPEAKEGEYKRRLVSCYPIHPEVFDRLYQDWAAIDGFQRTRGVLRLMAAVINELWMADDARPMIMPCSIPLSIPYLRDELIKHLPQAGSWSSILDSDVDGKSSIPFQKDQDNPRFGGMMAARRVARTIMLGSATSERSQNVRGIESARIRLGAVQPGEPISTFNDALNTLSSALSYLYTDGGGRYWYDTRPTLRKTVDDRASAVPDSEAEHEVEKRLKKLRTEHPLGGIHICPATTLDVGEDQKARLVLLRMSNSYSPASQMNSATEAAEDYLNNRGTSQRNYRNMLVFLAPDKDEMPTLKQQAKQYLAWKSILSDKDRLNIDRAQEHEAEASHKRADEVLDDRIKAAYCWLLVPTVIDGNLGAIEWKRQSTRGGSHGKDIQIIIQSAARTLAQHEDIVREMAPSPLKLHLDRHLWKDKDEIKISDLWEYMCSYCYLPRLANESVLHKAIMAGVNSDEYFAFASGIDGGRYVGLKFNRSIPMVETTGYLVKIEAAKKQLAEEAEKRPAEDWGPLGATGNGAGTATEKPQDAPPPVKGHNDGAAPEPKKTSFFMSANLDHSHIGRDVQKIVDEVLCHLTKDQCSKMEVSLEIHAESSAGFAQQTVRTISENCRALGVKDAGFDG